MGRRNLTERFAKHLIRQHKNDGPLEFAIAHGHSEAKDAGLLAEMLEEKLPDAVCAWQTEIGAALGVHAGMQALVVAVAPREGATL